MIVQSGDARMVVNLRTDHIAFAISCQPLRISLDGKRTIARVLEILITENLKTDGLQEATERLGKWVGKKCLFTKLDSGGSQFTIVE